MARPTAPEMPDYIAERKAALSTRAADTPDVTAAARIVFARGVPSVDIGALLDGLGVRAEEVGQVSWTDGVTSGGLTSGAIEQLGGTTIAARLSLAAINAGDSMRDHVATVAQAMERFRQRGNERAASSHMQLLDQAAQLQLVMDEVGLPIHSVNVVNTSYAVLARVDEDARVVLVDLIVGSRVGHWDSQEPAAR
ncbi:hypothetical protein HN371_21655 [Candidatus Poribacteria bacterium]|nr:hypothetical protein [Candidatus Poribacteria bacterium]MBT5531838.1 hypothetical protein [Candidatus Poribacteria bacterium]MBT5712701.1 hypothetical protein [Candidatus Poribacteria bacterium]MBT7806096.1 hypothetical protein [Candidatus Poribacteria bacterium]